MRREPPLDQPPDLSERYSVLLDLARTLASSLDPAALYAAIHSHVARTLPMSAFAVLMNGESGGTLRLVFRSGEQRPIPAFDEHELARLRAGGFIARPAAAAHADTLAAPLIREDRLLGCLTADRAATRSFFSADAHFLLAVGRLAAVALDNARLFAEVRQRSDEAERLEAAAREFNASFEVAEVAQRVAARANEVAAAPVVLWLSEGVRARAAACAGDSAVRPGETRPLTAATVDSLLAAATGPAAGTVVFPAGPRDRHLLPLVFGGRLVAFLAVGPWPGSPPESHRLRLLDRLAPHAAAAIENARLQAELRRLSLTDPLVHLPNRRQLDWFLEKEFAAALRDRPLCLVLFDLDNFKTYNDTQGHQAGDEALVRFADVLRTESRAMNLAARYGGEEFAAVLSGTGTQGGIQYAERVRRGFEIATNGRLTVSAGVAEYDASMTSSADLIVAADRALYRAKLAGRNRVCCADDEAA